MKYKRIYENPQEVLEREELKKMETVFEYIDGLKGDKLAELPLMDLFDASVYLGLKKKFYHEKYAESYNPKEEHKNNPNMKELRKVMFLYRMMPHAFGLVEKAVLKVSNKGIIGLAEDMVRAISIDGSKKNDDRKKEIISKVQEIEELLSENKE